MSYVTQLCYLGHLKNCARMRTDISIATDKIFTGGTNLIRMSVKELLIKCEGIVVF